LFTKKTKFIELVTSDSTSLKNHVVSIIGGGGKTTLMYKLSEELAGLGLKVVLTSTTKFQPPPDVPLFLQDENEWFLDEANNALQTLNRVAIGKNQYGESRVVGVASSAIFDIRKIADIILIEADGSRQRGLKTHKEYEPVIPNYTKTTIIVVSADTVGRPLTDDVVHHSELFAAKWNLRTGSTLTPGLICRELLSPYSYLKNVPIHSSITYLVNKSDRNTIGGRLLADKLIRSCEHHVFLGSLKNSKVKRISKR